MQSGRLFGILYCLLERGRATAPELAKRFEVSVRTIYRDVDALSGAGIPICTEPGRRGGISLLGGFVLDRSLLSEAEQQQILFALQSVSAAGQVDTGALLEKLGGVFRVRDGDWIEIDFSRWGGGEAERERFALLKNAILQKEVLRIEYRSARGETMLRRVKPARLVYKAREWYLQGFCLERGAYRTFKITRMGALERTGEFFPERLTPPPVEEPAAGPCVTLRLRFAEELAYRVCDEFDPRGLEREENGDLMLTAVLQEDRWLYGYLLSFGGGLEVLSPERVRRRLAEEAQKIVLRAQNHDGRCQGIGGIMGTEQKQEGISMEKKFCQSCGMPLEDPKLSGTEADGSKSEDYCSYCYQNGAFAADCTMDEMIDFCVQPMVASNPGMSADKAREMMRQWFPMLKRWKKQG